MTQLFRSKWLHSFTHEAQGPLRVGGGADDHREVSGDDAAHFEGLPRVRPVEGKATSERVLRVVKDPVGRLLQHLVDETNCHAMLAYLRCY